MGKLLGYYVMPHPPIAVPEIGKGEDEKIAKTKDACFSIGDEIKELKADTVIVITPHGPLFRDAIALSYKPEIKGDFRRFGVPQLKLNMNINMHLTENIMRYAETYEVMTVPITENSMKDYNILCELDHGALVPLYFISKRYKDFEIVHITYGMLSKIELYKFGMAIRKAVEDSEHDAVLVASGDLSHRLSDDGPYGYNELGPEFDREIIKLLRNGDVTGVFNLNKKLVEEAGECGLRSFYILLGALEGKGMDCQVLSYEGPFGVGYGVMKIHTEDAPDREFLNKLEEERQVEIKKRRKSEEPYIRLARESLEYHIRTGEHMKVPEYATEEMLNQRYGAFVSIKKHGDLRGCIGTISPVTENLATEIMRNAVEAGEGDPRFYPVEEEELDDLEYSVDVLMPAEKASREDLDPKKYGVIVRKGGRAGLLLPDLEGVNTVDEQLRIALSKAGISENEDYTIERFEVIRHR